MRQQQAQHAAAAGAACGSSRRSMRQQQAHVAAAGACGSSGSVDGGATALNAALPARALSAEAPPTPTHAPVSCAPRQVRGLDIRKLDKGQFTRFGRLIDKSFQMPREFQCMTAD